MKISQLAPYLSVVANVKKLRYKPGGQIATKAKNRDNMAIETNIS